MFLFSQMILRVRYEDTHTHTHTFSFFSLRYFLLLCLKTDFYLLLFCIHQVTKNFPPHFSFIQEKSNCKMAEREGARGGGGPPLLCGPPSKGRQNQERESGSFMPSPGLSLNMQMRAGDIYASLPPPQGLHNSPQGYRAPCPQGHVSTFRGLSCPDTYITEKDKLGPLSECPSTSDTHKEGHLEKAPLFTTYLFLM